MTPEDAAEVLRLRPNASAEDVERAFRARARLVHPDRLSGASADQVAAAAAEFARLTEAHRVMQRVIAEAPIIATIDPDGPPRGPRWLIIGWLAVMLVAGIISYFGGALPYSTADVVLRLLPLAAAATAFALTGRRVYYAATIALLAASVLITLALATFGSLVALGLLLVPVIGLMVQGRKVVQYRP
ncbi:DnaJ domain-containing protein [Conyzicola sp.]|uniref:DnaJ domain-containing protein n=1 Tax=Conyzicola sp. TaxID=1969404 RepID=UPI00398A08EC